MDTKRCKLLPNMAFKIVVTLICILNFYHSTADANQEGNLATYIVHLELPDGNFFAQSEDQEEWYQSFLPITTTRSNGAPSRMVYSYRNVITGFAARLSPEEVKTMEKKEGFVSARPQKIFDLHTTYTPYFLGLNDTLGIWNSSNFGKGVIVGLLDTGITPNHPSFRDEGMPPPPAKWKGKCELVGMACNNKLIGARAFLNGSAASPLDEWGHGTHTSSTAAGNFVKGANVLGNANGTAVGMTPLAHLAMYRVCLLNCSEIDILAGMDAAIEDGVDVLSISLGKGSHPFYADAIAMGAFAAIQKGIFVSCAAGNGGPFNASLSNEAPWILTVGASTIDRSIRTTALLGNNYEFDGQSLFQPHDFAPTLLPLVYAGMNGGSDSAFCDPGTLNNTNVKGKVVLCERGGERDRISKGETVKDAGGAAMILMNRELDGFSTQVDAHVLPATHVSFAAGQEIKNYINSTSNPTATILFRGTVIGGNYIAPMVSSFSSRGPSLASPGILKPDIIGPGVSILAAWSFPINDESDSISMFNVLSGTSMSCPHLSGIAALVKSVHHDWSPAAIKSAIMTTAYRTNFEELPIVDQTFLPADLFAIGSGHVNPSRVNDPGLVYDIKPDDYIPYLCGLGYSNQQVSMVTRRVVKCAKESSIPEAQLNYPSFAVQLGYNDLIYTRTVTNVGEANSSYNLQLILPPGVNVSVKPDKLEFSEVNQQMTYHVTFRRSNVSVKPSYVEGFLEWISTKYFVRIPVSVKLV